MLCGLGRRSFAFKPDCNVHLLVQERVLCVFSPWHVQQVTMVEPIAVARLVLGWEHVQARLITLVWVFCMYIGRGRGGTEVYFWRWALLGSLLKGGQVELPLLPLLPLTHVVDTKLAPNRPPPLDPCRWPIAVPEPDPAHQSAKC
jgi:hypothetical protein